MVKNAIGKREFNRWLNEIGSDEDKRQRLICQFYLLRYIQKVGYDKAYEDVTKLISSEDQVEFNKIIEGYDIISTKDSIFTLNHNPIPKFLFNGYVNGKIDRATIDIVMTRNVLRCWERTDETYLKLLLPICHIILKWDNSKSMNQLNSSLVTFNGKEYNPFELVDSDNLPLLDDIHKIDATYRKKFVLGCVDFAGHPKEPITWKQIHGDYKFWLSVLKLWYRPNQENDCKLKTMLVAMIISFLKHVFLDTYGETQGMLP